MPDQIYIGNPKGLQLNRTAFNIDNEAFATLFNMYAWRGRVKRKRGTSTLARLRRQIKSVAVPDFLTNPWQYGPLALVGGAGNLITGPWTVSTSPPTVSLESGSSIVPGSITVVVGANTYTEPSTKDGSLVGAPAGTGTINYATGALTITGGGVGPLTGTFSYYPDLPVMGLQDFVPNTVTDTESSQFPVLEGFDTTYSYQINQTSTAFFYSTSYYKGTNNPVTWSGFDYQQFWSCNYQSALWVTNNKPGLHIQNIATITTGNPTTITATLPHGLITGDFVFFNEITGADAGLLNGKAFSITRTGATTFTVAVDTIGKAINNDGIYQTLTHSKSGQDGIRWYDGDPTGGTGIPIGANLGWVNFAPPLTAFPNVIGIDDQEAETYYLVGALAIVPFKDRLLFFSPYIQTSSGNPIQLQDVVLWSWNGTPYYNTLVPTVTNSVETFDIRAYYVDQTGFGGYLPAGIDQPIATVIPNEDVLLVGFGGTGKKTRFVYTGNDLQPFLFYLINSELPSSSTFSSITMDDGGIDIGSFGIAITTQQSSKRIDLEIPDSVFQIQAANNGQKRVNAIRNFYREWIYFTYPTGNGKEAQASWKFPSSTFMFNYRDNTWAILRENYTHHGTFRKKTSYTWATLPFKTWADWREPWNAGSTTALFSNVIAGNPQGYVIIKDTEGTGEAPTGAIAALSDDGNGFTQVTSYNHCVNSQSSLLGLEGDYLYFSNAIGTTIINTQIGLVTKVIDIDNFVVDILFDGGTYSGLGEYTRLSQPELQTKQFPFYWDKGRKVRLGAQRYLLDTTASGQVTLEIFLSQDPELPYNFGNIVPEDDVINNSLEYTQILFTCPESTNLGLTPANVNLQMPTADSQTQIWHRVNTSLIGDTVQVGITLSDAQMRDLTLATSEISLHAIVLNVSPSQELA